MDGRIPRKEVVDPSPFGPHTVSLTPHCLAKFSFEDILLFVIALLFQMQRGKEL